MRMELGNITIVRGVHEFRTRSSDIIINDSIEYKVSLFLYLYKNLLLFNVDTFNMLKNKLDKYQILGTLFKCLY